MLKVNYRKVLNVSHLVNLELESATEDVSSTARPDASLLRRIREPEFRFPRALHDSGGTALVGSRAVVA